MDAVNMWSPMQASTVTVEEEEECYYVDEEHFEMCGAQGDSMPKLDYETQPTQTLCPLEHGPFFPPPLSANVEFNGVISMTLARSMRVFISANEAVQIFSPVLNAHLTISACGTHLALVHPMGRALQYLDKIEVQRRSGTAMKAAKMWHKGVSFTGKNSFLVYLVDEAGVRSSVEFFRDLYAANCACRIFVSSANQILRSANPGHWVDTSIDALETAEAWSDQDGLHWRFKQVTVTQAQDGFVTVTKDLDGKRFLLRLSPNNGKAKVVSPDLYMTASLGREGHLFLRSGKRKIHMNNKAFVVRNGGTCAGFDEQDKLRIW